MKKCSRCHEEKQDTDFYKQKAVCKPCYIKNVTNHGWNLRPRKEIKMSDSINHKRVGTEVALGSITLTDPETGEETTKSFAEWSRHEACGVHQDTIRSRAKSGRYSPRECVFSPSQKPNAKKEHRKSRTVWKDESDSYTRQVLSMRWV